MSEIHLHNSIRDVQDAIVVSHDRWFLDRIATHILAFEEDGQVQFFLGNWSEYEQYQRQRMGDSGLVGGRKHRPLKRS